MVRPGYKQTEVGEIPEDWDVKTVCEVTDRVTNGFVGTATTHYTDSEDGVIYIQGYNVEANSFNFHGIKRVTKDFHLKHKKSSLREADLLTVQTGDVGLTTIVPKSLIGANCHALIISRFKKEKSYPLFYAHYFNSSQGRLRLKDLEVGTTMKHINVSDLLSWSVPYPSDLKEQKAIAKALSDVDELIVSLEKLIAKKRDIKTATMQQLLTGKKRLPGFEGEWKTRRLDELANIRSGGTPSTTRNQYWGGDILWCTPTDITSLCGNKYLSDTNRKITQQGLQSSSAELIPANSIVMTSRATIGECAINTVPVSTNQGFKNLVANESVDVEFLYYLLLTQKQALIGLCAGSTFLEIGKTQLNSFELHLPSNKTEQVVIASIISDIDKEIEKLRNRLHKTKSIKQGMMQELLTGRTRLLVKEDVAA